MNLIITRHAQAKLVELGQTEDDLRARLDRELSQIQGLDDPDDIMLHSFSLVEGEGDPDEGEFWMVMAMDDGTHVLTVASFEETEMEPEGNFGPGGVFEGKKLMMPTPKFDDEEDIH